MRKPKPTANPSRLLTIRKWWEMGYISDAERDRMRKEALGINVYKGKARTNENKLSHNKNLRFGKD